MFLIQICKQVQLLSLEMRMSKRVEQDVKLWTILSETEIKQEISSLLLKDSQIMTIYIFGFFGSFHAEAGFLIMSLFYDKNNFQY